MKKQVLLFSLILLLGIPQLKAQFSMDAELRTRGEYRNGYKTLPTKDTHGYLLLHQRSRLNAHYKKDNLQFKLSIQDARTWGESKFRTDNNTLDLFEAWAIYHFSKSWSIKIGRQVVAYDDYRLFTTADWKDYGQALDLGILRMRSNGWKLDIGMGVNNNKDATCCEPFLQQYEVNQPKYLTYAWAHKAFFDKQFKVSMIYVGDGSEKIDDPGTVYYRHTFGPYMKLKLDGFIADANLYYQTGKLQGKDISAHLIAAGVGYQWDKTLTLKANMDHRSGSDLSSDKWQTETNSFDNLFGPGHKYLGFMDYFGKPVQSTSYAGIFDFYLSAKLFPQHKWSAYLAVHYFSLDKDFIYVKSGDQMLLQKVDKGLGQETDLVVSWKPQKSVKLDFGMSYMLAEDALEQLKGVEGRTEGLPFFGWVQLTFKPQLFKLDI